MSSKTVAVTGASGFLGCALVRGFSEAGYQVIPISYRGADVGALTGQLRTLLELDGLHAVLNAGACQSSKDDPDSLSDLVASNVLAAAIIAAELRNVLKRKPIPFVNFGSSWQINASGQIEPFNAYAATKTAAEAMLEHFALDGLPITTLRLYDTYGPGDKRNKVINLVVDAFVRNEPLSMSPGGQLIDLVYIDDVVNAAMIAVDKMVSGELVGHQIFSVRSGSPIRVLDLVRLIAKELDREADIDTLIKPGVFPYRNRERFELCPDTPLLPGWKPSISLRSGLRMVLFNR